MGDIIPETGTEVIVTTNSQGLDDIIDSIESDEVLSQVLAPALEQLLRDKQALETAADNLAMATAERIKSYQEQFIAMNQSVVTGTMQDSIFVDPSGYGDGEVEVGATALSDEGFPYPVVIENGSRPHPIEGNPLLAFNWPGKGFIITHSVQHPGTSPKPFVEPSLEYISRDLEELVGAEVVSKFGE
jgi:hypothetical protein